MDKKRDPSKKEKGQSLVELGVSLMFLFILLAGIVDIGRAFYTFISLRDAAQEGASFGSINPTMCSEIRDRIRGTSNHPVDLSSLGNDDIHVLIGGVECENVVSAPMDAPLSCNANEIKVEVTLDGFKLATPFLGTILGTQELTLTADVKDAIIVNPCGSS